MSSSPDLRLNWCSFEAVKYACTHWHYSKSVPVGKLVKVGVWENKEFIGCLIYSRGANNHLGLPYGLNTTEVCELTRVALKCHRTPVSRILSISIKLLQKFCPGLRLIVSYADPEHDHHGGIYQATNWIYTGQSIPSEEFIIKGKRFHGRSISAIKPKHLSRNEYAKSIDNNFQVIMGSSKHRYLMPLDNAMHGQIAMLAKPYPKRPKQAMTGTTGTAKVQHLSGRSNLEKDIG